METAKIFTNGKSQAVRLPKSCRFSCDEVGVQKIGDMVILFDKSKALENFLASEPITDDVYEAILDARREDAAWEERRETL
ncbi:MAG: type II toxin-antitoxin system VapB family antitoxin [Oscillospiraceae bacterium]|nr:type II toxin-antitoxin system VapB family antitoxin [Oscillospiraceae bacterium]